MSNEQGYPDLITELPRIQAPADGVRGWLLQAPDRQLVFFDIEAIGSIPPHNHGAQWGMVVEGEMDLTIDGETRRVRPGDSYYIPAGAVHSATFLSHCRAIDLFADSDRYQLAKD